jgi:hypothetical protein
MNNGGENQVHLETYLRIRPLDGKNRGKLKVDYYNIHPQGLPTQYQTPELPKSVCNWKKNVLAVQGHPMASGHHMS